MTSNKLTRNRNEPNTTSSSVPQLKTTRGKREENITVEVFQTSIAPERPGIVEISPPITLSVKSNFFCKPKNDISCTIYVWLSMYTILSSGIHMYRV